MGTVNYFRRHIRDIATMLQPLSDMCKGRHGSYRVTWNDTAVAAFHKLRTILQDIPKLYYIDTSAPIFLYTDACKDGIGAYLYQEVLGVKRPIAFLSQSLKGAQLRWAINEKEQYAIVFALKKLQYLLRDVYFTLRTDHLNLNR